MDELAKIALVGTSKYAGPLPATEHLAASLLGLADDDRERSLLLRCGAHAVYRLAGHRAVTGIEPTVPAPRETKRRASPGLSRLLQNAVTTGGNELLIDFLRQMETRSVVLPPELLPLLLDSKDAAVRQSLIPVLGERGAWLCRQNPDWSHLHPKADLEARVDLEELKQIWDEGTIDQRLAALAIVRRHDPSSARDWVTQVWAKEKAALRVRLVESFETGLCNDDEAFLESCLNDRSSAVAQSAARHLCRLPQSALAARMRARAASILGVERSGLIFKQIKLVCTPPQQINRDWERDGIPMQAPSGVGERAFWTVRVLAAVPPSYWQSQFGLEPHQLIAAVADDPFAEPIVAGWSEAAVWFAQRDTESTDWLMPLWRHRAQGFGALKGTDRTNAQMKMHALIAGMSLEVAEGAITGILQPPPGWNDVEVLNCVTALRAPWSAKFSAAVMAAARRRIQSRASEAAYRWANVLATHACAIPVDAFPLALASWEVAAAEEEPVTWFAANIQSELNKFVATIEMRSSFISELNA